MNNHVFACSVEKDTQIRRESSTLMAIYLTPQMIPDSPAEPEPEKIDFVEPKVIPYLNKDSNVTKRFLFYRAVAKLYKIFNFI